MRRKLRKPSPAMLVACVALFVALGPAAYASHLVVTTSDIVDGEVRSPDLRNFGVTNTKLAANSIGTGKIIDGHVTTPDLANGAVTNAKLGADSVESGKVANGSLIAADLADGAVTNAKLADGAVTNAKLGADSVGSDKVIDGSLRIVDVPIRLVQGPGVSVPNGSRDTDFAGCNADEVAVGGGVRWDVVSAGTVILLAGPSFRGDGTVGSWRVDGSNTSGATRTLVAFAYCLKS